MAEKNTKQRNKTFKKDLWKEKIIKEVSCIDMLRDVLGFNVVSSSRSGNPRYFKIRGEKSATDWSSLVIDAQSNRAYYNRDSASALHVIDLYVLITGESFVKARDRLKEYCISREKGDIKKDYTFAETYKQKERGGFIYPKVNENFSKVYKYLHEKRCLHPNVLISLFSGKKMNRSYACQEEGTNNVVFIGKSIDGKGVFGCKRGIGDVKWQQDCYGSMKKNGFFFRMLNKCPSNTLVVTESVIDGLSYMSMLSLHDMDRTMLLGCSGASTVKSTLKYNLENNKELSDLKKLVISLDNDEAGFEGTVAVVKAIFNGEIQLKEDCEVDLHIPYDINRPHIKAKDLNELLVKITHENEQVQENSNVEQEIDMEI